MYPEDRVLVGVITRRRDLRLVLEQHWYRIPQVQMPRGMDAEYIAFFTGSRLQPDPTSGIHLYAPMTGLELAYRRDLLPDEPDHSRADAIYYRVALGNIETRTPPITNPSRRSISFIHTTWDRFAAAVTIDDLYSRDERFVDRVFHALH